MSLATSSSLCIVPQIYCSGSAPSPFKTKVGAWLFDPKWVRHVAAWKFSAVAAACFVAADGYWKAMAPEVARQVLQLLIKRQHGIIWLDLLRSVLWLFAANAVMVSGYITVSRVVKYWFNHIKPTDAEYQAYLRNLANNTMEDIFKIIKRTKHKYDDQELIDAFIQVVMHKEDVNLLDPNAKKSFFEQVHLLRKYASPALRELICEQYVTKLKTQDAYITRLLVKEIMGTTQGTADLFQAYAESELAFAQGIDHGSAIRQHLAQLNIGEIPSIIVQYVDDTIHERIERIYVYAVATRYKINDVYHNSGVYYSLLHRIALFCVHNVDYRNFDEARSLLKYLPNQQKIEVIEAMLRLSFHCQSQREELETMRDDIQTGYSPPIPYMGNLDTPVGRRILGVQCQFSIAEAYLLYSSIRL